MTLDEANNHMRTIRESVIVVEEYLARMNTERKWFGCKFLSEPVITCRYSHRTGEFKVRARIYNNGFGFYATSTNIVAAYDKVASKTQAFEKYNAARDALFKLRAEYLSA